MILPILIVCAMILSGADDPKEAIRMDEVVVTATKREESLKETPFFGTLVERGQIERADVDDLGELLSYARFISIREYGPNSMASISIRGVSSSQVLVLIDGERLNNSQSGGADLDKIPLEMIERIEIIRGGHSALHGADAVGGVINLITSSPVKNRIKIHTGLGAFGRLRGGIGIELRRDALSGLISLSRFKSDGDFEYEDKFGRRRRRINAGTERENLFAKLIWEPRPETTFRLSVGRFRSHSGDPGMMGYPQPTASLDDDTDSLGLYLRYGLGRANLRHRSSSIHYLNLDSKYKVDDTHRLNSYELELSSVPIEFGRSSSLFGVILRRESLNSTSAGDRIRDSLGVHLSEEVKLRGLTLFGAVRWDGFSDFGSALSPKVGFRFALADWASVKGSLGRSYRAPTFNDLYWPEDAFAKGNPDLEPERATSAELGMQISRARLSGSLVLFSSVTEGLIQWAPGRGGRWYPQNLKRAEVTGIETETGLRLLDDLIGLQLSYSLTDARDQDGYQLLYRPTHSFKYRIKLGRRKLWATLSGVAEGKRFYRKGGGYLDPYDVHDLNLGFSARGITITFTVRNLLNERYMLAAGYPLPGRSWHLGISGEWEM
jgi:outer membrane receptor for ferrienterochelin and colicins